MTVKEVAARTGLTNAAIYKRLKKRGVQIEAIKDKETGHFTADGERLIIELFHLDDVPEKAENRPEKAVDNQVEKLSTRVNELTTENERLRNQVDLLTSERDNLRAALEREQSALEREQQLHAMALTKLLPSGEETSKGRFRAAWDALKGRRQ